MKYPIFIAIGVVLLCYVLWHGMPHTDFFFDATPTANPANSINSGTPAPTANSANSVNSGNSGTPAPSMNSGNSDNSGNYGTPAPSMNSGNSDNSGNYGTLAPSMNSGNYWTSASAANKMNSGNSAPSGTPEPTGMPTNSPEFATLAPYPTTAEDSQQMYQTSTVNVPDSEYTPMPVNSVDLTYYQQADVDMTTPPISTKPNKNGYAIELSQHHFNGVGNIYVPYMYVG